MSVKSGGCNFKKRKWTYFVARLLMFILAPIATVSFVIIVLWLMLEHGYNLDFLHPAVISLMDVLNIAAILTLLSFFLGVISIFQAIRSSKTLSKLDVIVDTEKEMLSKMEEVIYTGKKTLAGIGILLSTSSELPRQLAELRDDLHKGYPGKMDNLYSTTVDKDLEFGPNLKDDEEKPEEEKPKKTFRSGPNLEDEKNR